MKIVFDKINQTNKPFKLTLNNISLDGILVKRGCHRVKLDGNLKGTIELICDRCGCEFKESMNSPLNLTLSDEVIETEDDLDIIEFIDGIIDLKYILQSEIESVKNAFHNCKRCEEDEEEFQKEF